MAHSPFSDRPFIPFRIIRPVPGTGLGSQQPRTSAGQRPDTAHTTQENDREQQRQHDRMERRIKPLLSRAMEAEASQHHQPDRQPPDVPGIEDLLGLMGFHRPDDVPVAPAQHALQYRRHGPDHDTDHDAPRHAPTVEAEKAYGNLAMGEQCKAAHHEHPVQDAHVP